MRVRARQAAETRLAGAVHDLTGRQAFLSALLDTMDVEVVAVDAAGQSVVWNQASRAAYGVPALSDSGRPQDWSQRFGLLAADGLTPLTTEQLPLLRALAGEHVHGEEVVTWPTRQTARRLLVHARPIHLPDGTLVRGLTAAHDITELRAQQDELTRRNRDFDALGRATTAVLTGTDARTAICSAARDVTDALAVLLFEPDPTGRRLTGTSTAGLTLPELAVPVDAPSLTARSYRTSRTQLVADLTADPDTDQGILTLFRSVPGGQQLRSAVFVPVIHDGRTRAVLVVTCPGRSRPTRPASWACSSCLPPTPPSPCRERICSPSSTGTAPPTRSPGWRTGAAGTPTSPARSTAPPAPAARSASSRSTWTTSRPTTAPTATPPATPCSTRSPPPGKGCSAPVTPWPASAARSSPFCCPTAPRRTPRTSPRPCCAPSPEARPAPPPACSPAPTPRSTPPRTTAATAATPTPPSARPTIGQPPAPLHIARQA